MVAERRDYVALDWVAAEIGDTLVQARAALDAYLNNPGDIIQLRFCLTYIHQVYGTLKMVEFAGAALLAEEMETTAHALLADELQGEARNDALTTLQHALTRLPDYLQQLQQQRVDRPTARRHADYRVGDFQPGADRARPARPGYGDRRRRAGAGGRQAAPDVPDGDAELPARS